MAEADEEKMDVPVVLEKLNAVLSLQHRSALQYALVASGATGLLTLATDAQLWRYAQAEYEDLRRLISKIVALGGKPTTDVPEPDYEADLSAGLGRLIDHEQDVLAALHDVIPNTGQQPGSEALEHLLEHLIMRKQDQVDSLIRARSSS